MLSGGLECKSGKIGRTSRGAMWQIKIVLCAQCKVSEHGTIKSDCSSQSDFLYTIFILPLFALSAAVKNCRNPFDCNIDNVTNRIKVNMLLGRKGNFGKKFSPGKEEFSIFAANKRGL